MTRQWRSSTSAFMAHIQQYPRCEARQEEAGGCAWGVWLGGEEANRAMIRQPTHRAASAALSSNDMWCRPQEMAKQACCCSLFGQYVRELLLGGGGEERSKQAGISGAKQQLLERPMHHQVRRLAWLDLLYCDAVCGLR